MGFEVPPSPVGAARLRWPVVALAAGLAVLVGVAVLTRPPASPTAPTPAVAVASATPPPTPPPATPPPPSLPTLVACRQLDTSTCRGLAQAALAVLPPGAPPIATVTVYRSLLCRDDLDCPPARLAVSGAPSGSVIIGFADGGPDAWIDVVTRSASSAAGLEAWILR